MKERPKVERRVYRKGEERSWSQRREEIEKGSGEERLLEGIK